jgi:hypothetical protein
MLIPNKHNGYRADGRRVYPLDFGGDAPAPDYTPLAQASEKAAESAERLGNRQLDFAERQYAEMRPLAERVYESQIAGMDSATRIAEEERAYGLQFRPAEERLLAEAMQFDTAAAREARARQAAADAARAFGSTKAQTARGMSRMGVAPGSGAFGSNMNQNALAAASMRSGAMNQSRMQSEEQARALLTGASALGRGQTQTALGAMGLSSSLGSAGQQTAMAPGNQYMQGLAAGASTIGSGYQQQIGGLGSILGTQANVYNQSQAAKGEMMGAVLGIGAAYAGRPAAPSDRRLKENIELVGRDERTMLPLYEFEYKGGDGRRFLGVMADDVEKVFPQAVIEMSNGYKAVDYDLLGIEMVEV